MTVYVDDDLRTRLAELLASRRPTIEPELRRLADEGAACARILRGELERREQRLEGLSADAGAPLAEIVEELTRVRVLREHVDELGRMLAELDRRARELRAGWLGALDA